MRPEPLFQALIVLWVASEFWLGLRRRSGDPTRRRDRGSLTLLLATIYASLALAVLLAYSGAWRFAAAWRPPLFWLGLALMFGGLIFRWWAIRVLAQFFTVDVSIRDDHRLVRDGPYRWLRHPSYTGALATFYGFALALGNWASLLAVTMPVTAAFLRRIRVEEQALREAFPVNYPAYAARTRRLLPWIW